MVKKERRNKDGEIMQKGEKKAKKNPSNSNQSSLESNPSTSNPKPQASGRSKREVKAEEHLKLTEDESDQLGRTVSLDKWIERTKDGKNGGFCVFGYLNIDPMPELKGQGANSQFEIHLIDSQSPLRKEIQLRFAGPLAGELYARILFFFTAKDFQRGKHQIRIVLSNYGAQYRSEQSADQVSDIVIFSQGQVTVKLFILDGRTSHFMNKSEPVAIQHDHSFSSEPRPVFLEDHQHRNQVAGPSRPSRSSNEQDIRNRSMSSMNEGVDETSFSSAPAASNSKSNAQNDSDPRDGKKKPNKSLPANYDFEGGINCHVPFQLDGQLFTPLALVRKQSAPVRICGIVLSEDVPITCGFNDDKKLHVKLHDPSLRYQTSSMDAVFSNNLFGDSKQERCLPNLLVGSVLVLSNLKTTEYQGNPQGVGYKDSLKWYALKPHSIPIACKPGSPKLGPEAEKHVRWLSEWYNGKKDQVRSGNINQGVVGTEESKVKGRRLELLKDIKPNVFFDCLVKVVRVFSIEGNTNITPQIYVTDFTSNPLFLTHHDTFIGYTEEEIAELQAEKGRKNPANKRLGGSVFLITLYGNLAQEAEMFKDIENRYILLRNVRPKLNAGVDKDGNQLPGTLEGNWDAFGRTQQIEKEGSNNEFLTRYIAVVNQKSDPVAFQKIDERRRQFDQDIARYHKEFNDLVAAREAEEKATQLRLEQEEREKIERERNEGETGRNDDTTKFDKQQAERKARLAAKRREEELAAAAAQQESQEDQLDERIALRHLANGGKRMPSSSNSTSASIPQPSNVSVAKTATQIKEELLSSGQLQTQSQFQSQASIERSQSIQSSNGQSLKRSTQGEEHEPSPSPAIASANKRQRTNPKQVLSNLNQSEPGSSKVISESQSQSSVGIQRSLEGIRDSLADKSSQQLSVTRPPTHSRPLSISEVKAEVEADETFQLRARIVDFLPRRPQDWSRAFCKSCERDVASSCPDCGDQQGLHYFWSLSLLVEDESSADGNHLLILVYGKEANHFFQAISSPRDAHPSWTSSQAAESFSDRLAPVFGKHLLETSPCCTSSFGINHSNPLMDIRVRSFKRPGTSEIEYALVQTQLC